jgi:hypothetical protein
MFGFKRRAERRRLQALTLYSEKRRIYDPLAVNPRTVQEPGGRYGLTLTELANLTNGMAENGHKHAGSETGVAI